MANAIIEGKQGESLETSDATSETEAESAQTAESMEEVVAQDEEKSEN